MKVEYSAELVPRKPFISFFINYSAKVLATFFQIAKISGPRRKTPYHMAMHAYGG